MTTRRSVLGALAVAAGGGLAGCSVGEVLGGGSDAPAVTDHRTWLASPAVFERDAYLCTAVAPTPLLELREAFHDDAVPDDPSVPVIGVDDHELVDQYVLFGSYGLAATGSFDQESVVDALQERAYEAADPIRGFDAYVAERETAVVDDGLVVFSSGNPGRERVTALLATRDGERERYHAVDEQAAAVLDALDDGQIVSVTGAGRSPPLLEGASGLGYSASLGEESLTAAVAVAYPEGETDAGGVESWANQGSMFYGADVSTTTVGRAVRAEATVPLAEVTGFPATTYLFPTPTPVESSSEQTTPQVAISFDYASSDDGGTLTITNDGGDHVAADRLAVRGATETGTWADLGGDAEDGAVRAGDSLAIPVDADATVLVVWLDDDGEDRSALARWDGPDG